MIQLVDDIYVLLTQYIGLRENLMLICTSKTHQIICHTELVTEYRKYKTYGTKKLDFIAVCRRGYLNLAKYMHALGTDIHENDDDAFLSSIENNHTEVAKWLVSVGVDIHTNNDYAFKRCCRNGCIDNAKWLFLLSAENPRIGYQFGIETEAKNSAFIWSCESGRMDVAQWLYSIGADIHTNDDDALTRACYNCHIHIAKWLYSLGCRINIGSFFGKSHVFNYVCKRGNLEMAQWLYSLGANVNQEGFMPLRNACESGNVELVEWLNSVGAKHGYHVISECLGEPIKRCLKRMIPFKINS